LSKESIQRYWMTRTFVLSLEGRNIGFKSLTENIDMTSSGGKLIFHIFGALAEFERDLIRERTNTGLQATRARGKKGGRPKAMDQKKAELARKLYRDETNTIDDILKTFGVS
jgi:DNA invertase Pin-like site-specific DNA recombinase